MDARRGLGAAGSLTKAAVPENRLGSADGGDGESGMGLQVGLTCSHSGRDFWEALASMCVSFGENHGERETHRLRGLSELSCCNG